ncbi:MAG: MipA/OmpV family protein [Pseudomonas sp.]|nr:MipA/OmpV family protein [Pseudomonas sp.]
MFRITSAVFAALLGLGGFCATAQATGITGEAGLGMSNQPYDPTGSRYETVPVPYFDLDWGDVSLSTDDGLTWSALKGNGFSAGPFINYIPGRNSNGTLRGLHNVSAMGEAGGFVQYSPADFWRIFAFVGHTVGANRGQGGVLGRVGGEVGYPLGLGIIGSSELTAKFADGRQTQTFFGVSEKDARDSEFRPYKASGGLQNVALTQSFEFPLAAQWSLVTSASWIHLTNSAADSSIVKQEGRVNQGEVQAAISYKFN